MNTAPSLLELAAPLQVPGALPEGISLSVGLIANTPPRELAVARREAGVTNAQALIDASPGRVEAISEITDYWDGKLATTKAQHEDVTTTLTDLQLALGAGQAVGYTPPAFVLDTAMSLDDLAARTAERLAGAQADAAEPKEVFEDVLVRQMRGQLDLADAAPVKELADQIGEDQHNLSRRGRLTTIASGMLLTPATTSAAIFGTGLGEYLDSGAKIVVGACTLALGGLASTGIASRLTGRFAHGRARKLVQQAREANA